MTDPRTALEEAFKVVWPDIRFTPEAEERATRFRRLLDAEAWTDAAMMLVPEGYAPMIQPGLHGKWHVRLVKVWRTMTDLTKFEARADSPALALAAACIKAKEAGDVHHTPA